MTAGRSVMQLGPGDNRIHTIPRLQDSSLCCLFLPLCIGLFSLLPIFLSCSDGRLTNCSSDSHSVASRQGRAAFSLDWKISEQCSDHLGLGQRPTSPVRQGECLVVGISSRYPYISPREEKPYRGQLLQLKSVTAPWPIDSLIAFTAIKDGHPLKQAFPSLPSRGGNCLLSASMGLCFVTEVGWIPTQN